MIDEHEWKYVLQAASDGTFSAAAKKLFVSQPSLSQSIKKIEGEIGMPLFDRSQTPLQLTAAGEIYVRKAKEMQRIYHELVQETADLTGMKSGTGFCRRSQDPLQSIFAQMTTSAVSGETSS